MQSKTPFIVFFITLALSPFISSIHAISETGSVSPGFPSAGEGPEATVLIPITQTLEPLTVFEEARDSNLGLSTTSQAQLFSVEEVLIQVPVSVRTAVTRASHPLGRLVIPSISLNAPIGSVGLTSSGDMDVLDDPKRVGWYKNGAVPGERGSAVIGAHVFQAFSNLKNVKIGNSIYVEQDSGSKLRFIVSEIEVHPYTATNPLPKIFNRSDKAHLTLITCDGKLTADRSTYENRLVVFAELAG